MRVEVRLVRSVVTPVERCSMLRAVVPPMIMRSVRGYGLARPRGCSLTSLTLTIKLAGPPPSPERVLPGGFCLLFTRFQGVGSRVWGYYY